MDVVQFNLQNENKMLKKNKKSAQFITNMNSQLDNKIK